MGIELEKKDGVATVTLNRPEALNALDLDSSLALAAAWEELAEDDAVRVVVVTGQGERAFCSGGDLKTLIPLITSGGFLEGVGAEGNVFLKKVPLYKPVIARVNGDAIAGGTEILQATDLRVAVEGARFGLQEVRWALFPSGGSTVRLAQQIPYCHAMEILLTGKLITAEEAAEIGLINKVVAREDLDDTVDKWIKILLRNGPVAQQRVKQSVLATMGRPLTEGFKIEADLAQEVYRTQDALEGPRAFTEKRDPVFTGN